MSAPEDQPQQFPALEAFFLGYLHEDLAVVHGDAQSAMEAFVAEADMEDLILLAREWRALGMSTAGLTDDDRLAYLQRLGMAWEPSSWLDALALFDRVEQAIAGREPC